MRGLKHLDMIGPLLVEGKPTVFLSGTLDDFAFCELPCPVGKGRVQIKRSDLPAGCSEAPRFPFRPEECAAIERAATLALIGNLAAAYLWYCVRVQRDYHLGCREADAFLEDFLKSFIDNQERPDTIREMMFMVKLYEGRAQGSDLVCSQLLEALKPVMDDGSGYWQGMIRERARQATEEQMATVSRLAASLDFEDAHLAELFFGDGFPLYPPEIFVFCAGLGVPVCV